MAKVKRLYRCMECGGQTPQWAGRCADCGAWNSLEEEIQTPSTAANQSTISRHSSYAGEQKSEIQSLSEVTSEKAIR